MKNKLILKSLFSQNVDVGLELWTPSSEVIKIVLNIDVSYVGEDSVFFFNARLMTPEALMQEKNLLNGNHKILITNRTIVISHYDYKLLENTINKILTECSRNTFSESCMALERYFQFEYEDWGIKKPKKN